MLDDFIRRFALSVMLIAMFDALDAGVLRGKVKDEGDAPVSYVSIYIRELTMGTSSNESGNFEVTVPDGIYTVSFLHLAYETVTMQVTIPGEMLSIKMKGKKYELPAAQVGKREDPAYGIMRKAIGMAPFYNKQLSYYKAEVYIKGTLIIDKISGITKMLGGKELKQSKLKEKEKYLLETVNEISYNKGKYKHRVISESNTFPQEFQNMSTLELGMFGYNIYSPRSGQIVSPLSSEAFVYYRFRYEGFINENDLIINKIRVIPKRKNPMTMEGYIYIIDDFWYVQKFELTNETTFIKSTVRQNYGELQKHVSVPVSMGVDVEINLLGNKAKGQYINSIRYTDFKVNPLKTGEYFALAESSSADTMPKFTEIKTSAKSKKFAKEIEKFAEKEEMSNRDAYKMARLVRQKEKEDMKNIPDSLREKPSLDLSEGYVFSSDSAAKKRDSTYWANIRPIPLLNDEVKSYVRMDSIKKERLARKSDSSGIKKKRSLTGAIIGGLFVGHTFRMCDSTLSLYYGGLFALDDIDALGYNSVDGWRFKQHFGLNKRFKDTTRLSVNLEIGYAFARKAILAETNINYTYLPKKQGRISLVGGYGSKDFNRESAVRPIDNMMWSLFAHENYANYYHDAFIALTHRIEPVNGFVTAAGLSYHSRKQLHNNSEYSFFYRDRLFKDNFPANDYALENLTSIDDGQYALAQIVLSYTPQMRYIKRRGAKYNVGSHFPSFELRWKKGIPKFAESVSNFDFLQISIHQTVDLGVMRNFAYKLTAGWFPNISRIHFADAKHFETMPFFASLASYNTSFGLRPVYSLSEIKNFFTANISYCSPFLLLKYLPILDKTLIRERLRLACISTPKTPLYSELSYSLSEIFLMGELGIFAGFDKFNYRSAGFKIAFNLSKR
ncbi:MAG: DUF5686 and carboxypeptidase regulatory-like domain-containing protein [Prevotellaceae bacterium]|jgi:hypothetical protein|nr:DUF5686 and carboxypeptidase regulatory-like domain-containing protein [Prevotellaceae bacterium]